MATGGFYLLLDNRNKPVARGKMISTPGDKIIQMRVQEDKIEALKKQDIVQLMSSSAGEVPLQAHVLRCRDDVVFLERMGTLNPEVRRNLRIPVKVDTFLYPISAASRWKGRREASTVDLSCGGVAFYSSPGLEMGDKLEIVIPVTENPILMNIQILRLQELKNGRTYYAAKFIDMCRDEEEMICEAVFSIQLEERDHRSEHRRTED